MEKGQYHCLMEIGLKANLRMERAWVMEFGKKLMGKLQKFLMRNF